MNRSVEEIIKQRRSQMLVHSYLYYWLDSPLVSHDQWQKWADELTRLQKEVKEVGFYDKEFADWDGSTGMHLPKDPWVIHKATQILRYSSVLNH